MVHASLNVNPEPAQLSAAADMLDLLCGCCREVPDWGNHLPVLRGLRQEQGVCGQWRRVQELLHQGQVTGGNASGDCPAVNVGGGSQHMPPLSFLCFHWVRVQARRCAAASAATQRSATPTASRSSSAAAATVSGWNEQADMQCTGYCLRSTWTASAPHIRPARRTPPLAAGYVFNVTSETETLQTCCKWNEYGYVNATSGLPGCCTTGGCGVSLRQGAAATP